MNFTTVSVDHSLEYGNWDLTTKTWSDAVGLLASKKIDISVIGLEMDSDRSKYIDFSWPAITSKKSLVVKLPDTAIIKWSTYFMVSYIRQ